jgi:hypothetical protein
MQREVIENWSKILLLYFLLYAMTLQCVIMIMDVNARKNSGIKDNSWKLVIPLSATGTIYLGGNTHIILKNGKRI